MGIKTHNLSKVYQGTAKEVYAVNGIDLSIESGTVAAIIGPSGAGKSTLLHLLGGLDLPTRGRVVFDGVDLYTLSDAQRAKVRNRKIGFVFQFYHLLPEFTALENVMLPAMINGHAGKPHGEAIRKRSMALLAAVGLKHRLDHKPSELSGGESQRVAIARALVNEPEVVLCDEPTGNLDSKTSDIIYELLFGLRSKCAMTLVIVTHDEKISHKADTTIHIRDGKVT